MRLESVREFKAKVTERLRIFAEHSGDDLRALALSSEPTFPALLALGVARLPSGEFAVAIRTSAPALAEGMREEVHGEADVRVLHVTKRPTSGFLQGRVRPLEPGAQVGMADKPFVGTLGCLVRRRSDGVLGVLSNSHVLADEGTAQPGHLFGQPFGTSPVGSLTSFVPLSRTVPNLVDAAWGRLADVDAVTGFNGAVSAPVREVHDVTPDDLGREVLKVGRTTGVSVGKVTAVEVDGLPVAYDQGTLRFNDQVEVSGGPSQDFSAAGDSGSLIVTREAKAIALLFAGGRDAAGEDFTYGNRVRNVLDALGLDLA